MIFTHRDTMFLPSKFHEIPFMNVALTFALIKDDSIPLSVFVKIVVAQLLYIKAGKTSKDAKKIFIWHGILKIGCHGTFPTQQIVALLIRIV